MRVQVAQSWIRKIYAEWWVKVADNQFCRRLAQVGVERYRVASYVSALSPTWLNIHTFLMVRWRSETIFRVGLLDRQSEVRFCVSLLVDFTNADGTVRFRRRKMFWLLSVWFHGCSLRVSYLSYVFIFRQRSVPRFTMEIATWQVLGAW